VIINYIYKIKEDGYDQNNFESLKYSREKEKINIPSRFLENLENKKTYEGAQKIFGIDALDTIVSHEFGHQANHYFLRKQESASNWNIGQYGDICLTHTKIADSPNVKLIDIHDFFKANNKTPNGIVRFMQQNFMESYADIYSGLIVYLKNDSKDIFDKIKTFRELNYKEIKDSNVLSINDGQVLKGKFSTTEYFNFHGIQKFKDNLINSVQKEDILNIANNNFEAIHHIIQVEALDGLYKTMKEEAKNNNLFLLELKDFCQTRHNCSINTFFDKFESHLNNIRTFYCQYDSINTLDNNAPYFDFDNKCSQLSKKDIIKQYRKQLQKEDLIKFDKANFSELKLNQFSENYGTQQSNYNSQQLSINLEKINNLSLSQTICSLREKFLELKTQNKSLTIN